MKAKYESTKPHVSVGRFGGLDFAGRSIIAGVWLEPVKDKVAERLTELAAPSANALVEDSRQKKS